MRPRKLQTENRILRAIGGQDLTVSLGRAVKEIFDTPTMTDLIKNQPVGVYKGMTEEQREQRRQNERMRQSRAKLLENQLINETDPIKIENITNQLDAIGSEGLEERDSFVQESIEAGRLMGVDQLKEEYGDLLEFDSPMTKQEASALYDQKRAEAVRNAILEASPKGVVPTLAKLGAGVLNQVTDPLEVGTMLIPFVGSAGRAASIARFGRVGGRASVGAVEGMLGAAVTEPIYYGLSTSQQLDYTAREALLNVGAGLILGGGIGTVAGVFARRPVDANKIAKSIEPDNPLTTTVEPEDLPSIKTMSESEALEAARTARSNVLKTHDLLGGKVTADMAIRQMVNDLGIDVSLKSPRIPKRPPTLSDFIRARGGINDSDPTYRGELAAFDIQGRAAYTNAKGTMVNGISNPTSGVDADEMARAAAEAGYITNRDTNELFEAIAQEKRAENGQGEFVFAAVDQQDALDWRTISNADNDMQAEIARREDIREALSERRTADISEEEVAYISSYMARTGEDLEEAIYESGMQIDRTRDELEGLYAVDPKSDPFADFEASTRIDEIEIREETDIELEQDEAIVQQLRDDNLLTEDQLRLLDEIAQIDEEIEAFTEVVNAVSTCIVRS